MLLYQLESTIILPSGQPPLKERLHVRWHVAERPSLRLQYDRHNIANYQIGKIDCIVEDYLNELFHENEISKVTALIEQLFPGAVVTTTEYVTPITPPDNLNELIINFRDNADRIEHIELLDYISPIDLHQFWGFWYVDIVGVVKSRKYIV